MSHVAVHSSLDILSICTGGGGLDLGVELAIPSARSVVLVEREAFAVAQLVSAMEAGLLHPAPLWSDAKSFDGRRWRGCVDGLIGGIPCQGHSLAGKKRGSLDERDLWSPARRIIVQARPWFVLIENVGGMLSPGDDDIAGAERVWRDLRKLGFAVEGGLFTASEVGASHERERIFILGVADARRPEWRSHAAREHIPDGQEAGWGQGTSRAGEPSPDVADSGPGGSRSELADTQPQRHEGWPKRRGDYQEGRHDAEPGDGRDAGLCSRESLADTDDWLGEQYARPRHDAGDGTAPDRQRSHAEPAGSGRPLADTDFTQLRREPSAGEQPFLQRDDATGAGHLFPPGPSDSENWQAALERAPELEPAFRRVADGLASRLDIARVDRLRMLGNGVVPLQAAYAVRTLATRLAERGSPGAACLVRMMEFPPNPQPHPAQEARR